MFSHNMITFIINHFLVLSQVKTKFLKTLKGITWRLKAITFQGIKKKGTNYQLLGCLVRFRFYFLVWAAQPWAPWKSYLLFYKWGQFGKLHTLPCFFIAPSPSFFIVFSISLFFLLCVSLLCGDSLLFFFPHASLLCSASPFLCVLLFPCSPRYLFALCCFFMLCYSLAQINISSRPFFCNVLEIRNSMLKLGGSFKASCSKLVVSFCSSFPFFQIFFGFPSLIYF